MRVARDLMTAQPIFKSTRLPGKGESGRCFAAKFYRNWPITANRVLTTNDIDVWNTWVTRTNGRGSMY